MRRLCQHRTALAADTLLLWRDRVAAAVGFHAIHREAQRRSDPFVPHTLMLKLRNAPLFFNSHKNTSFLLRKPLTIQPRETVRINQLKEKSLRKSPKRKPQAEKGAL